MTVVQPVMHLPDVAVQVQNLNKNDSEVVSLTDTESVVPSGGAPTAPADVTLAVPASNWITYGSYGHALMTSANYALWKTWGFTGHNGGAESSRGGFAQLWKGSTAAGDSTPGAYDWQRAYEGLAVASINGGATGLGIFKARQADPTLSAGLVRGIVPGASGFGDIFTTARNTESAKCQSISEFIKFMGGNMLLLDLEIGTWGALAGHTQAATFAQWELFGYELGTAIWATAANTTLELIVYNWLAEGAWVVLAANPSTPAPYTPMPGIDEQNRSQFMYGIFRAHKDAGVSTRIRFIDSYFYRGSQWAGTTMDTALKWNTQGRLAVISRKIADPTVYSHIAPLFDVSPFSWAGTDGGGFNNSTQENEPLYTNNLEFYRKYGMGMTRAEFTHDGGSGSAGTPGRTATQGGQGLWAGGNNYLTPSGRITRMQSAVSTDGSYSTTAPTLTATPSGLGTTRTIAGTASHAYGIRWVKAYIYPFGVPVAAQMTFNLNGGTPTTNINNSYMDYTLSLTGVSAGNYAIVTAYSTLGQEHSLVVPL